MRSTEAEDVLGNDDVRHAAEHDLVFDGERFIPGAGVGIAYEHWSRYAFAQQFVEGRDVLDVACGEGYGSAFLAGRARSVTGFDASSDAVAHARGAYPAAGLSFQQETVRSFFAGAREASFDVVVAFEMIEHLPVEEQALLLDGIRRVLRPDGLALVSTPDKLLYTDRPLAKNPFHVRELYRDEFEAELRARFAEVLIVEQSLFTGAALVAPGAKTVRGVQMRWTDLLRAKGDCAPVLKMNGEYLVAVVSQRPLPEVPSVLLADFSRKLIAEGLETERRTADRLAGELEEARRAWQAQGAETRSVLQTLSEERAASASELSRMRELAEPLLRDLSRLGAREEAARAALQGLRDRRSMRLTSSVRALAKDARAALGTGWKAPVGSARELARKLRNRRIIERSGLFDREFYLAQNPDVATTGIDPLDHFLEHGAKEGRDPHPLFDISFYLGSYPEVAQSGKNPFVHFLRSGWKEHRRPNAFFDTGYYLTQNPDVAAAGLNPLKHYIEHGAAEGRSPSRDFDAAGYLAGHPGAAAGRFNPVEHALRSGGPAPRLRVTAGPREQEELERWRKEILALPRRALVVDDRVPTPDRDSGSITTLELMKALQALGYAVTFVPFDLSNPDRYVDALRRAGFWCLTGQALLSVRALIETHGGLFDVVMLARVSTACQLMDSVRAACPDATLIFETMDLHYLREEREAALTGSESARLAAAGTKAFELDIIRRADLTLVHSDVEQQVLSLEVPDARVRLFPYVLEVQGRGRGFDGRSDDIVFIGGFLHKPNIDAVTHFARNVVPLVREQLPSARLVIVGSDPSPEVLALAGEGVAVLGYVEDLKPVLDNCRLTVAPLRYGAGYKGKVAMSMAHGVPGVLSLAAAEGMGLTAGGQVLIADIGDAAAFAKEVVRLHRDPALWERLSQGSLGFVAEQFSPMAARDRMGRLLRGSGAVAPGGEPALLQPGHAIYPSRFMRALHEQAGLRFERADVVPHGVDFQHPAAAPRADRTRLLREGSLRLLIAGRLVHFKGVHTALEALPRIVKALPALEVELTLVGDAQDAPYMEKLRRMISEGGLERLVRVLPAVKEDALFALFQEHDLYLFPSLFEPFALTLILALEAGIPTVAAAAGGSVDIVTDGETGLLFPAGDAAALAKAVSRLAADGALRHALSVAGHARAARYTTEAMLDRFEAALTTAAQAGESNP
jgi:glycosyltransferase involved in cell wall biosynthesis/2-polyprenyl-3-methyl-5-hydroxy-6-metoxy-1,4-benzoquinol methylase